ncbi:MAG: putative Ig domain-containing protein [Nitrospirae bacterium]|nr:putative Ig domain-containing protein [Nitrospirota bacterium]
MFKRSIIIIILFSISIISSAFAGEADWSVHIKVSVPDSRGADGTVWNHLIAGVREGATDGFNSALDTLSMVEADYPIQSMFTHGTIPEDKNNDGVVDNWVCKNPEEGYTDQECSLWRDIRAFGEYKVWSFLVFSTLNGGTVTLNWSFEDKPADMDITLVELSNAANAAKSMDMRNSSLYVYTNTHEAGKKYGVRYFEIRMKTKGLFITPPQLPDGTMGSSYNEKLSAIGGSPVWKLASGNLPPGMSLNTNTGDITGTPTETGIYSFTITGVDPVSKYSRSRDYTLNINSIPNIDVSTLPDGVAGEAYRGRITVRGGSAPIVWSILGNLPEGVLLDSKTGILSGTLIVPGIYDFTAGIRDVNGATDSKDIRITVKEPDDKEPPDAISDLRGIYLTDTSLLLMWSAPSDDSLTGTAAIYDLRYMESCPGSSELDEGTWDMAVELHGERRPQARSLQTYTLSGLKAGTSYCIAIKSMDSLGHISAISNIVNFPLSGERGATELSDLTSSVILKKGYNLISIPLMPVQNDIDLLFERMVGKPVALYRWYSAYPGITPPRYYMEDMIFPGNGYFLYSPSDNITLTVEGLKTVDPEYSVMLQNGWNMIGNPYEKAILLSEISVKDNSANGIAQPFMEAVQNGLIGNTLYYLNGNNYDFASFNDLPPAAFEPWIGYWIYVNNVNGVEIRFKKP